MTTLLLLVLGLGRGSVGRRNVGFTTWRPWLAAVAGARLLIGQLITTRLGAA
jgi:hypothetical protein